MQTNISARHGRLSTQTQDRIAEKVEKLQRYFDRVTSVQVTVNLEHRDNPSVELKVSAERTDVFVAVEQSADVLSALDGACTKWSSRSVVSRKEEPNAAALR